MSRRTREPLPPPERHDPGQNAAEYAIKSAIIPTRNAQPNRDMNGIGCAASLASTTFASRCSPRRHTSHTSRYCFRVVHLNRYQMWCTRYCSVSRKGRSRSQVGQCLVPCSAKINQKAFRSPNQHEPASTEVWSALVVGGSAIRHSRDDYWRGTRSSRTMVGPAAQRWSRRGDSRRATAARHVKPRSSWSAHDWPTHSVAMSPGRSCGASPVTSIDGEAQGGSARYTPVLRLARSVDQCSTAFWSEGTSNIRGNAADLRRIGMAQVQRDRSAPQEVRPEGAVNDQICSRKRQSRRREAGHFESGDRVSCHHHL